jgi:hypothetical protein
MMMLVIQWKGPGTLWVTRRHQGCGVRRYEVLPGEDLALDRGTVIVAGVRSRVRPRRRASPARR